MAMERAVLVGINKYVNGNNLKGCRNDVNNMLAYLTETKKCPESEIVVLKDEFATTRNIKKELVMAISKTKAGDCLFFHFSGHGTQVPDVNGDEADKKDEVLCPHDFDWDGAWISDDWLAKAFTPLPEDAFVEVVLDCCHSGTSTRNFALGKVILPPNEVSSRAVTGFARKAWMGIKGLSVVWAACDEKQTSSDAFIMGRYQGAFTYFWLKTLRKHRGISRKELLNETRFQLKNYHFEQIPQLEVNFEAKTW
jgi:hypothetical protein